MGSLRVLTSIASGALVDLRSFLSSVCPLELKFACLGVGRNDRVGVLGGTSLCLECMYVCVDGYLLLGVGLSLEQYEDV
jgi:hypothetical protein